jgi:hypothetical protein
LFERNTDNLGHSAVPFTVLRIRERILILRNIFLSCMIQITTL